MEAPPSLAPCWRNIVKEDQMRETEKEIEQSVSGAGAADGVFVGSCKSTKGIAVAVVDANAIIQGGERLGNCAEKFFSVSEVIHEVRDPNSRRSLHFLPFTIETMDPSPEALKKVISFARATGDLQTLSDVDLKLIALTYTLEAQIHGTSHLRDSPPPIHTVNVKRLPEKDLPGWGSNVPNLEEWEALENAVTDESNSNSRILPLRDLSLNVIPADKDQSTMDGSLVDGSERLYDNQEGMDGDFTKTRTRKFLPKKKEVNIEGKKMVASGVDASQGQYEDNLEDWSPAVSRSTRRRYLRRKARREMYEASCENDGIEGNSLEENRIHENSNEETIQNGISGANKTSEGTNGIEDLSTSLNEVRLEDDAPHELLDSDDPELVGDYNTSESVVSEGNAIGVTNQALEKLEITSHTSENVDISTLDDRSEQSWMLRSLSDSTVACITSDFAMQNVLLQIGLRLLAPGGMQIRELHRWVLKCHACYKVTTDVGRIFCPSCGNGGTLRKVAVTVGENGIIIAARRPRISIRGTKFSLPLPQGGRDAITKNPILREDQIPLKYLHPKTKKKNMQGGEDIFASNAMFIHHTDKRAPLQPPVRKALAVFSGKRNPNDNHFSRSKH